MHTVLDKQGVHLRIYIAQGNDLGLYARLMTQQSADRLALSDDRPALPGLTLVKHVFLPWDQIRRVRIWREGGTLLFYRPSLWQAAAVRCPGGQLNEAEAFVRKKMKRFKKVRILSSISDKKKKKR